MNQLTVDGCELKVRAVSGSDGQRSTVNGQRASSKWRVLVLAPLLLAASACGNIEPWVKPYEREGLADPIMSFDANPVSTSYMHHVFEAREGARGAQGSAGGGCGCN
jgi:Domain of unknown function (DUF4266)